MLSYSDDVTSAHSLQQVCLSLELKYGETILSARLKTVSFMPLSNTEKFARKHLQRTDAFIFSISLRNKV